MYTGVRVVSIIGARTKDPIILKMRLKPVPMKFTFVPMTGQGFHGFVSDSKELIESE